MFLSPSVTLLQPYVEKNVDFLPSIYQQEAIKARQDVYKGAGNNTDLVIYLPNAKHLLFNILQADIPPLDGQTLPESRQKIRFFLI